MPKVLEREASVSHPLNWCLAAFAQPELCQRRREPEAGTATGLHSCQVTAASLQINAGTHLMGLVPVCSHKVEVRGLQRLIHLKKSAAGAPLTQGIRRTQREPLRAGGHLTTCGACQGPQPQS